jgi:UDP:flavonoid glycosyltransferase YjiC (YdhE family)
MRIGFLSLPVPGHLNPMTTLAGKLQSRGHDVVFMSLAVRGRSRFFRMAQRVTKVAAISLEREC